MKATLTESDPKLMEDTLENLVANLNTGKDKNSHGTFVMGNNLGEAGNREQLDAMYREDWVSGKLVDIIPDDMTREWRKFDGDLSPEEIEKLENEEKRIALASSFNKAHKWARLYGTAFIIIAVDDGVTPDKPLDINKIKNGALRFVNVVDRHRISPHLTSPVVDPMSPSFGLPEFYTINETATVIHHSRLLRFEGTEIPYEPFRRQNYNNDPILARLYGAIRNFNTVAESAASMIYEANVDIYSIPNLMSMLENAKTMGLLIKRMSMVNSLKSFNNAILLDDKEKHTTKTYAFAGIKDLITAYETIISAGGDVPTTRMFGSAASGFNATGEGDADNYNARISSEQNRKYRPNLDYFDLIMAKSLGIDKSNLSYYFNSLEQVDPKEDAEIRNIDAQTDSILLTEGVITPLHVIQRIRTSKQYVITDEDISDMESRVKLSENEPNLLITEDPEVQPENSEDAEGGLDV